MGGAWSSGCTKAAMGMVHSSQKGPPSEVAKGSPGSRASLLAVQVLGSKTSALATDQQRAPGCPSQLPTAVEEEARAAGWQM